LTGDQEGYGALELTDKARPLLRGAERFMVRLAPPREKRVKGKRETKTSSLVASTDQALFGALRALRLKLATDAKLPPYVICHDKTLAELAAKRPATEAGLHDITGLGASKIKRYGAAFLETISSFKAHPLLENRLPATVNQTLALHLQGLDAERIGSERRLETTIVYSHFAEAIEAGLLEARGVLALEEAEIDEILGVFERLGTLDSGKLGPAHSALDGRFDIGVLKCLLAELA
jgi:ATP-dependent DNA helicase RecQ